MLETPPGKREATSSSSSSDGRGAGARGVSGSTSECSRREFHTFRHNVTDLRYGSPNVEHYLFPTLFPWGIGGFITGNSSFTNTEYCKLRLHAPRDMHWWQDDWRWIFYKYSCVFKERIAGFNNNVMRGTENMAAVKDVCSASGVINSKYATVPRNIGGSAPFFHSAYLDLAALVHSEGLPTYFLTITISDRNPVSRVMLAMSKTETSEPRSTRPNLRPYDSLQYYLWQIKQLIKRRDFFFGEWIMDDSDPPKPKCVNRVKRMWFRQEAQPLRQALHAHALITMEKQLNPLDPGIVIASKVSFLWVCTGIVVESQ